MRALHLLLFVTAPLACEPGSIEPSAKSESTPHAATTVAAAPVRATAAAPAAPAAPTAAADIEWTGPIAWRSWEEGMAEAKSKAKSVCLLVYADWCPKCRNLAPVFRDPEVFKLASALVMIRQDADDRPAWLGEKFADEGTYVPRILFLDSEGRVKKDITSGNARFPYFYTPETTSLLQQNLKKVGAG